MHPTGSDDAPEGRRLDSWKSIADYLGRDRTTVMRWERESGLPVRRIPGKGRSVYAYTSEIDRWLAAHSGLSAASPRVSAGTDPGDGRETGPPRRLGLPLAIGVTVLLLAAGIVAATLWKSSTLARVAVVGHALVAYDASERQLWEHALPAAPPTTITDQHVGDVDGDDRADVIVGLQRLPAGGLTGAGEVARFDSRGRAVWRHALDDRYTFDGAEYGPMWYPEELLVYRAGGATRIAVTFHHDTWWPSVVATFDANGSIVGRFVNPGWIRRLNVTRDGRYLLAGGVSNPGRGSVMAVLDAAQPAGTAPLSQSPASCIGCPPGQPVAYVLVPWSDVAHWPDALPASVSSNQSGDIELRAAQSRSGEQPVAELIVTLSPSFDVRQRTANDAFVEMHARLERSGKLSHPFASCPWRVPPVRIWTPAAGWRDVR
jgi:hypothetical protein